MKVGVPKETAAGERRVALVPEVIKKMAACRCPLRRIGQLTSCHPSGAPASATFSR